MKKLIIIVICTLSAASANLLSKGTAGDKASYESMYIIDMPTAGMLVKSYFLVNTHFFHDGGISTEMTACPFKHFQFGLSYSADRVIGSGDITGQGLPGFHIKIRPLEETRSIPAIAFGLNTQGSGAYSKSAKRFETYSPGVFVSVSKNFEWSLGCVAVHGGLGYSPDPPSSERTINFWGGAEQSLGQFFSLNFEYNANIDDGDKRFLGNKGTANLSLRWAVLQNMTLQFELRDLFRNQNQISGIKRGAGLEYVGRF